MRKLCLECYKCKQIPLDPKYIKEGYRPLLRCKAGRADYCEVTNLPDWDVAAGKVCPDFDGDLVSVLRTQGGYSASQQAGGGSGKYVNLAKVLPEALLHSIFHYIDGPSMVYLPSGAYSERTPKRDFMEAVRDEYKVCKSIRRTADKMNTSRRTVRSILEVYGLCDNSEEDEPETTRAPAADCTAAG